MTVENLQAQMAADVQEQKNPDTYTVRDLIAALAQLPDMDTLVAVSLWNSDPVPVAEVSADDENFVILTGGV